MMRFPKQKWLRLLKFRDEYFEGESVETIVDDAIDFYIKHIESVADD